jgi:hypothetical protein
MSGGINMTARLPRHGIFVIVWQLAPSLEAAAAVLKMKVRTVTRQANRLRAAGVPLKSLTDPRFNPHKRGQAGPLNEQQKLFMLDNFDFARRVAWRRCRGFNIPFSMLEDIVEDSSVEALIISARRSTEPGFVTETARGLLATVVRRQIIAILRSRRPVRPAHAGMADQRSLDPVQVAAAREELARSAQVNEMARSLVGALPDTSRRKESARTKEYLSLRRKARELGLSTDGTTEELRERLAAFYQAKLSEPEQVEQERPGPAQPTEVPACIQRRLSTMSPAKSDEQLQAERFVVAWMASGSITGVARRLGLSAKSVKAYAAFLKRAGVTNLPELPARPGPVVRGVLALKPSTN